MEGRLLLIPGERRAVDRVDDRTQRGRDDARVTFLGLASGEADEFAGGTERHYELDRLVELGATTYQPVTVRGEGFVTAAVVDPFGNVLGVMSNPHWAARV